MPYIYKSRVPKGASEIMDHLAYMMLSSPAFVDPDFIGRDLPTAFSELNAGLDLIQEKLGPERHARLIELSNRMRLHFEAADPDGTNGEAKAGRKLLHEMEELLSQRAAKA